MDLTRAWVADLKAIGYSFPQVHEPSGNAVNTHKAMALVTTPAMWYRYDAIVLVIMFNNPHPAFKSVYETLKTAYTPLFRRIVYTGYTRPNELPAHELWVQCESHMGGYQQMCFANVVQVQHSPMMCCTMHFNKIMFAVYCFITINVHSMRQVVGDLSTCDMQFMSGTSAQLFPSDRQFLLPSQTPGASEIAC